MEEHPFALAVGEDGTGPVVRLSGDVDLEAAPALRECLVRLAGQDVMIDFADVTFLDSTCIGVLVAAVKRARTEGGTLVLKGVPPKQMRVFEIVGLADALNFDGDAR